MLNRSVWFLLFTLVLGPFAQSAARAKPLFITNITIIDAAGNPPQPEMTVVITGDRITTLVPSARIKLSANADVVDGRGKFLIPGLWDSHLHLTLAGKQELTREWMAPMLIAHGVTTVRDMGGDWQRIQDLRRDIAAGRTLGPRIFAPGSFVDGPPSQADVSASVVTTAEEARAAVRRLKSQGVDFIKVQANLSWESYRAVMDEAAQVSIPVVGHVPEAISAFDAVRAGQRSVEHTSPVIPGDAGVMLACSGKERQLRAEMLAQKQLAADKKADQQQLRQRQRQLQRQMAETRDDKICADLLALFVQDGVRAVPTQVFGKRFAPLGSDDLPGDDAMKLVPLSIRARSDDRRKQVISASTAEDFALRRLMFDKSRELVGLMHRAGVILLAGTDAMDDYVLPGAGLHEELELMVEAGLTPLEALQSATRNPAQFVNKLDTLGTIERGKIADLVLLDADPLQQIGNLRKVSAVIVGGKLLSQTQRQELLTKIGVFAKQH